jgi:hypothetical protein
MKNNKRMFKQYTSISLVILCIISTCSLGCKSRSVDDPITYFKYVIDEKNGLFQEKTVGDYTFSLQYKSPTYMVLTDNENFPMNTLSFAEQEKQYETNQYYTFRIKIASDTQHLDLITYNLNSEQEYRDRIQYLERDMQKDILLVSGKDTSKVSSFIYDKSSDLNDYSSFLITFPVPQKEHVDRKFIFQDKKFKSGTIVFTIKADAIANAPAFQL